MFDYAKNGSTFINSSYQDDQIYLNGQVPNYPLIPNVWFSLFTNYFHYAIVSSLFLSQSDHNKQIQL